MATKSNIPLLETLSIELTNKCNERCKHCYIPDYLKDQGKDFSYSELCSIIDEFVELGGQNIIFTGGEILLYEKLLDILEYCQKRGLWIALFFNGMAITDKHIRKFKEVGVSDIQISLYSTNPENHDSITNIKGSCERTIMTIQRLISYGLPVRIACSVIKDNMDDICDLLDYTLNLGINLGLEFNIIAREDRNDNNLDSRLTPIELEKCLTKLAQHNPAFTKKILRRIDGKKKNSGEFFKFLKEPICGAAQDIIYITSNKEFSICPGWIVEKKDTEAQVSLKEFWEKNELLNDIRAKNGYSISKCLECEALDYCIRCFARNHLETGDYMIPPKYACEYAFIAKRVYESNNLD